jgi:hypothetical protein
MVQRGRRPESPPENRHDRLVDTSIRFQQCLFDIRSICACDAPTALKMITGRRPQESTLVLRLNEAESCLDTLRAAWPKLNPLECLDLATTITQAASLALLQVLFNETLNSSKLPSYMRIVRRRKVVRETLDWIVRVTGCEIPTADIVARVTDDSMSPTKANALSKHLIRNLSHIIAWNELPAMDAAV